MYACPLAASLVNALGLPKEYSLKCAPAVRALYRSWHLKWRIKNLVFQKTMEKAPSSSACRVILVQLPI